MTEFNLLPWRERRRARSRRNFLRAFASVIFIAALLLAGAHHALLRNLAAARAHTDALRQQLAALESPLAELRALREREAELARRTMTLQQLDEGRAKDVVLLDLLARTLPQDAYYTALAREGVVLRVNGMATGAGLSELMRAFAAAPPLGVPELREMATSRADAEGRGAFVLSVPLRAARGTP